MGVEKSLDKMKTADLVLYLFDIDEEVREIGSLQEELKKRELNFLLVANKTDKQDEAIAKDKFSSVENVIFISAKGHKHLEVLKERMVDKVISGKVQPEDTVVTNARHYHALKEVARSLADIRKGLDDKLAGDLLALDIRRGLHYLGEITGEITNEDQLDYIFSKFCIGK